MPVYLHTHQASYTLNKRKKNSHLSTQAAAAAPAGA